MSFKVARCVFDDPLAMTREDPHPDGDRWQTVGPVALLVVHTWPEPDETGGEIGRIFSARKATSHERRACEEGAF